LTGATGFVGSALHPRLVRRGAVRCLTRDAVRARARRPGVDWIEGDVADEAACARALDGCVAAYYLVHSIGEGAGFRRREVESASRFARAAAAAGVERIVYLGGVAPARTPSEHLRSRLEVGEALRAGPVPTIELRASMIIGHGSLSWLVSSRYSLGLALPLIALQGYFVAFLFMAVHETAHKTAFASRALNLIVGHISSFLILLPYEYYCLFHWDHHRFTQDPARDPELAVPLPITRLGLAWYWSGVPTWIGRARLLFMHGVRGVVRAPWVPEAKRALVVREARCYLLGYATVTAVSIATGSLAALWLWLLPLAVGQ